MIQYIGNMSIRVCVIGAGAAGLVALRHLAARTDTFRMVAYEQENSVGGTWIYTENTSDKSEKPVHSSMYYNLKTNLPKELMAFPDFPFPENLPSFLRHSDVLDYLKSYAQHFDITKYIQFRTVVERVHPLPSNSGAKWNVRVRNLKSGETSEEHFDAVMVCNGHYSIPTIPKLPGSEQFLGEVIHSHNYRHPERFKEQNVLLLGGGPSGTDIALDLVPYAKQIILSHRKHPLPTYWPSNIKDAPPLTCFTPTGGVLSDGTSVTFQSAIFCTGYDYTFPFLSDECEVKLDDNIVCPLYVHLIHTRHPTLSFLGIPKTVVPFPMFDMQTRFVLASLDGAMELPTLNEMEKDTERDFDERRARGEAKRHAVVLNEAQWAYNDRLADLGGFERLPRVLDKLNHFLKIERRNKLPDYKKAEYKLLNDNEFVQLQNNAYR